jgi:hypothetical protein
MDALTEAANVLTAGGLVGDSHKRRMEALLRHFQSRGLTLADCAHRQRLGRTKKTLQRYARRMKLVFPDYCPVELRPPKPAKKGRKK